MLCLSLVYPELVLCAEDILTLVGHFQIRMCLKFAVEIHCREKRKM